jgi:hypothetical protein
MFSSLERIRQWIVVVCFTLAASIFWGAIAAAVAKYFFDISPGLAILSIGLPVGVGIGVFLLPRLRSQLGFR